MRDVLPTLVMIAGRLDVVAGEDRREELDRLVGAEEPLVAVEADEELGRDVAEEREHARAVDELAGVVRVVRAHADAQRDRETDADAHGGETRQSTVGSQQGKLSSTSGPASAIDAPPDPAKPSIRAR